MANNTPKIKVIDSLMGTGKTSFAIQMMNEEHSYDKHFLFVTPFLDEVKRIKDNCQIRNFRDPKIFSKDGKTTFKRDHFIQLLTNGENIVTTHNLFKIIDKSAIEILYINNYTLILDEVMDVIEELNVKPKDVEMLKEKWLLVEPDTGKIQWNTKREENERYDGVFNYVRQLALNGNLVLFQNRILLWKFPIEVFDAFEEVYILTYLFDGQPQKYYYDMHKVPYEKYQVIKENNKYKLIKYDIKNETEIKNNVKSKIHIYDGFMNKIGEDNYSLSKSWYDRDTKYKCKLMRKHLFNYFHNKFKSKSQDSMWTSFKSYQSKLKGLGYTKGFVACNARATNQYGHKRYLAYTLNRFESPILVNYFKKQGDIVVNQELFALAELVQWIWRSAIRNGKEIYLFIPSKRMRKILVNWLKNKS